MTTTLSAASSLVSPGMTTLLNLAHDLNQEGPLPTGHGTRKPVVTARSGRTQVLLLDPKGQSRGESSMPNGSDWPNDAVVCSLSQVLVRGSIPQQYFLSSTACAGILRRAEKRGKELPIPLLRALQAVAGASSEPETPVDKMPSSMTATTAQDDFDSLLN